MVYSPEYYDNEDNGFHNEVYNEFWAAPTSHPNTHHEQNPTQHFPASVSVSDPFATSVPPHVTYERGGYEMTEASTSDQSILASIAALHQQKEQLSILMNRLPEHLRTPLPTVCNITRPSTVVDLLNDETLLRPESSTHHEPTLFASPIRSFPSAAPIRSSMSVEPLRSTASVAPIRSLSVEPTSFRSISPIPQSNQSVALSIASHVTTPEAGQHIHHASHLSVDRIHYTHTELPHTLPVKVTFLQRY
jgi:hypothetical protein